MMITSGSSVEDQYEAAISNVAFTALDSVGLVEVSGNDRIDLLHRLSTNDLLRAQPGQAVGTVFTTDKGRVVDYVCVLVKADNLLLFTSLHEIDFVKWIDRYTIMEDIQAKIITQNMRILRFLGPIATAFIQQEFSINTDFGTFSEKNITGEKITILLRNEFATPTVDIILPKTGAAEEALVSRATECGALAMDQCSYEAFRISRGIPALHHELTNTYNPYEVGLTAAISYTKGCYIGQEVIARIDTYQKSQKELRGMVYDEPDIPVVGMSLTIGGEDAGKITSVSPLPIKGSNIALGVVKKNLVSTDYYSTISDAGTPIRGKLRSLPISL